MELAMYPTSGGPPVFLTGDLSEEGMQSGKLDNSRVMEFPPLIDAPGVTAIDHGNEQNALSFVIQRTWDTPGDAAAYWLTHKALVPRTGRLRMRAQQPDGLLVIERWLNGAGIPAISGTFEGCATTFQYQIVGGTITPE